MADGNNPTCDCSMHEIENLRKRSKLHDQAIDALSRRLADVQMHPALSIPPLPGWETEDTNERT